MYKYYVNARLFGFFHEGETEDRVAAYKLPKYFPRQLAS